VVCYADEFEYDKGKLKKHKIDFKGIRGEMYAAYALCRFKDGSEKCEVMTKEEIEKIRSKAKAGKGEAWTNHYNEMAKKTVFHRLCKWLPLSPEIRDAVESEYEDAYTPAPMPINGDSIFYDATDDTSNQELN
jgi:phage RecT family recombinase